MLIPITSGAYLFSGNMAGTTPQSIIQTPIELPIEQVKTYDTEVTRLALKYNQDEGLVRRIIFCESTVYSRAENKNYRPEWNAELGTTTMVYWSSDIGYWQINDFYHAASALKMGLDIYKWEDNLEYGFWLMSKEGTRPWTASKYCWNKIE